MARAGPPPGGPDRSTPERTLMIPILAHKRKKHKIAGSLRIQTMRQASSCRQRNGLPHSMTEQYNFALCMLLLIVQLTLLKISLDKNHQFKWIL
jgi:hypothetical protein